MESVIAETFLRIYAFEYIKAEEGEIIRIDKNGEIQRSKFQFEDYFTFGRYCNYASYGEHSDYLYEMCNLFGLTVDDISLLYEMGYNDEEIELMLEDREYLHMCLDEARECFRGHRMEESYEVQV